MKGKIIKGIYRNYVNEQESIIIEFTDGTKMHIIEYVDIYGYSKGLGIKEFDGKKFIPIDFEYITS